MKKIPLVIKISLFWLLFVLGYITYLSPIGVFFLLGIGVTGLSFVKIVNWWANDV